MFNTPKKGGWIEVICGSMFSGKTEELLRRLRCAQIARQKIQVFKPAIDNRYHKKRVVSHDQRNLPALIVLSADAIEDALEPQVEVVAIDEAQFFDENIINVCQSLADKGIRVIVAGLDQDFRGEPFGPMPQLLAIAAFVTKNHAICICCGGMASKTNRLTKSVAQIEVGTNNIYDARCRHCFNMPVDSCPLPQ